ncbi:MAG: hypothetical protein ABR991_13750, partial [Terracidiphilus sp.]
MKAIKDTSGNRLRWGRRRLRAMRFADSHPFAENAKGWESSLDFDENHKRRQPLCDMLPSSILNREAFNSYPAMKSTGDKKTMIKIGIQGDPGSFSHEAAMKLVP